MIHIKTYEGLFSFLKKKDSPKPQPQFTEEDFLDVVKDIVISDLDDLKYNFEDNSIVPYNNPGGVDIFPEMNYDKCFFSGDENKQPILNSKFTASAVAYVIGDPGVAIKTLSASDGANGRICSGWTLSYDNEWPKSNKSKVVFMSRVCDKLNKERLEDYGIGCCLYSSILNSYPTGILFYTKIGFINY